MSRRPTVDHVAALIRHLDDVNLDLLHYRLERAIRRNDTGAAQRDGFPSGRRGDGGENTPQSSTEAAAWSNLEGATPDPVDEHLRAALDHLEQAVTSLSRCRRRLDRIDQLAGPQPAYDPSGSCLVCGRHVHGTANDRLRRGMCDSDYRAWNRAGRPDLAEFKRQRLQEASA